MTHRITDVEIAEAIGKSIAGYVDDVWVTEEHWLNDGEAYVTTVRARGTPSEFNLLFGDCPELKRLLTQDSELERYLDEKAIAREAACGWVAGLVDYGGNPLDLDWDGHRSLVNTALRYAGADPDDGDEAGRNADCGSMFGPDAFSEIYEHVENWMVQNSVEIAFKIGAYRLYVTFRQLYLEDRRREVCEIPLPKTLKALEALGFKSPEPRRVRG
ncbi:MAG: hypothetical protein LBQ12_06805 [Deltaproteobacteria bacterium]|jgi:hypothetical protein|nr:hypothetical protein [Deltaproteobacteria bacterium]